MPKAECKLHPLRKSDLDTVLAIQSASPEAAQWSREQYETSLSDDEHSGGLVAELDDSLVGFLLYRSNGPGEAEIMNLAVHPLARQRGIAASLLDALRRQLAGAIFLEVRASNRAARALYERSGFVLVGRRTNYYRDPVDDALVMKSEDAP